MMQEIKKLLTIIDAITSESNDESLEDHPYLEKYVLVRTYAAGVHYGYLKSKDGQSVILQDARRLWYWEGAFTLSAVAQNGVSNDGCKISIPVPEIAIEQVIEIIPISPEAATQLKGYPPHE